jgi:hypothetical protein
VRFLPIAIYQLHFILLAEVAIAACDLAEVLGMAIGINLLFGIPLIEDDYSTRHTFFTYQQRDSKNGLYHSIGYGSWGFFFFK